MPTAFVTLGLSHAFQHFSGVAFGMDSGPDFFDFAVFTDEEGAADDAHEFAAHELLFLPGTVGLDGFVIEIAQQRKIELVLGFERRLGLDGIGAHAKDDDLALIELFLCVTKLGRFDGSTGRVGFREKEKQDAPALEVFQGHELVLVGLEAEGEGFVAGLEHGDPSSDILAGQERRCARSESYARSLRRMSLTACGSAWPRVARMTWPTKCLKTPLLPDLNLATFSGFFAMTSRAACSIAEVSLI
jgi:hypothetical protein